MTPRVKNAPSYIAVLKQYENCSESVKDYFGVLPDLIQEHSWDVCLAYLFFMVEKAHNRILYCGLIKVHKADKDMAFSIVNQQHLTRSNFLEIYKNIFGAAMRKEVIHKIKVAEEIRNKVIHGKSVPDSEMREAIVDVLNYAEAINKELTFKPFGDLRGFAGARTPLDASTTRWLLKGLGFTVS